MASSIRTKWSFPNFYIELRMKHMGVGFKGPLERELVR